MKSSIPMDFGKKHQHDFSFSHLSVMAGYFCPEHWHDCFEIIYTREGSLEAKVDGDKIILSDGDCLVLPPKTLHSTRAVTDVDMQVFGYTENLIASVDISMFNMKYLSLFNSHGQSRVHLFKNGEDSTVALLPLLREAMEEYGKEGFCREIRVRSKILALHATLCEMYLGKNERESKPSRRLIDVEEYIERNIDKDVSPYEIAEALHISYSHLSRIINEELGYSIGELIIRMKINYAESLMTGEGERGITEIALSVGFGSASYFTRVYKRMRGVTPTAFRRMLRESAEA